MTLQHCMDIEGSAAGLADRGGGTLRRRMCANYRGITLLSLHVKVYSGELERRFRQIVELQIQEKQCCFPSGGGTINHLYSPSRVLGEFIQPVYMCFVDFKKVFDHVPQRGSVWSSPGVWGAGPLDTDRPL